MDGKFPKETILIECNRASQRELRVPSNLSKEPFQNFPKQRRSIGPNRRIFRLPSDRRFFGRIDLDTVPTTAELVE